jgi:hypothetical protein
MLTPSSSWPTTTRNHASATGTAEAINGSGVYIEGLGLYSVSCAFDFAAKVADELGAWDNSVYRGKTILVQMCIDYSNVNGSDGIIIAFDTAKTGLVNSKGYRSDSASANETYEVRSGTSDTAVETSAPKQTTGVISLYLVDGEFVWVDRILGTLTPPAFGMGSAYRCGIDASNNDTAPLFETNCNLITVAVDDAYITVTRILAGVLA